MEAFFTEWVRQEESLVSSLFLAISSNDRADQSHLLSLALAHIESYFLHKSCLARQYIVKAFYPCYLTPFERTFLWLGGFRPSLTFKFIPPCTLAPSSDADVTDAIVRFRDRVLAEEQDMSKQMAGLQEGLATRNLVDAMRTGDHTTNAHNSISMERVVDEVGAALHELLASADRLRLCTLRGIMETLTPADAALFITKAMNFHLQLRHFGLQHDNRGD